MKKLQMFFIFLNLCFTAKAQVDPLGKYLVYIENELIWQYNDNTPEYVSLNMSINNYCNLPLYNFQVVPNTFNINTRDFYLRLDNYIFAYPDNDPLVQTNRDFELAYNINANNLQYGILYSIYPETGFVSEPLLDAPCLSSRMNAKGQFNIGISPARPNGILFTVNGNSLPYFTEAENVNILSKSDLGDVPSSEFDLILEWSNDNTNWSPQFLLLNANSTFTIPSYSALRVNSPKGRILYLKLSVKKKNHNSIIAYSPPFYYNIEVRPKVEVAYKQHNSFYCNEDTTSVRFSVGTIFDDDFIKINRNVDTPGGTEITLFKFDKTHSNKDIDVTNFPEVENEDIYYEYFKKTGIYEEPLNSKTERLTIKRENPTILINAVNTKTVSCFNGNDGSISLTASNCFPSYDFKLGSDTQSSNSSVTFSGLSSGTYNINVTDSKGCIGSIGNIAVGQPSALLGSSSKTDITCFNSNNGSITLTAKEGTSPYKFSKDNGDSFIDGPNPYSFTNLAPANYNVVVKDANGCSFSFPSSISIVQPTVLSSIASKMDVTCFSANNGSITLTASGGTSPYKFSKDNGVSFIDGSNSYTFTNLAPANYDIVVKDANGCMFSLPSSISIVQPTVLSTIASKMDVTCFNANNGSITLTASGGTSPYKFSKDNGISFIDGSNPYSFTNLAPANYDIVVKDANGCMFSLPSSIIIVQPTVLSTTASKMDVTCFNANNGSITLTASGGTSPYKFSKDNGVSFIDGSNPYTFTNLAPANYNIVVKDANGCSFSLPSAISIVQPTVLNATASKADITCFNANNGSITLTASGGTSPYKFSKDNGVGYIDGSNPYTFTNLAPANYSLVVKDANGCLFSLPTTISITQPSTLNATASKADITCFNANDGVITITVGGGTSPYQFSKDIGTSFISGSNPYSFKNLAPGNYTLIVRDGNYCSYSLPNVVTLTQFPLLSLNVSSVTHVFCSDGNDGSIVLQASGGDGSYSYSKDNINWQTSNIFTGLSAATYTFYVMDGNGCKTFLNQIINQPNVLSITSFISPIKCNGLYGSVTITANGGFGSYNYSKDNTVWQTSNIFSELPANVYSFYVIDGNGCKKHIDQTLTQPTLISFSINSVSNVKCNGGNNGFVSLYASGGTGNLLYSKDENNWQIFNSFSGLTANTYNFYVKDDNGCKQIISQTITQPITPVILSIGSFSQVTCHGGNNGTVTLSASGGTGNYSYSKDGINWQASRTFENLPANTYTFYVKDDNECQKTVSQTISQPTALSLSISSISNIICYGANNGLVILSAIGGTGNYTYSKDGINWQASSTFENLPANVYTFYVKDSNDCQTFLEQDVTQPSPLFLTISSLTNIACKGEQTGSVNLAASGGTGTLSYSKDGTNWQASSFFAGLNATTYTFYVKDENGCQKFVCQTITQPSTAVTVSNFSISPVTCNGSNSGSVTISASGGTGLLSYSKDAINWQPSNTFFDLKAIMYTFYVKDYNGCSKQIDNVEVTEPAIVNFETAIVPVTCKGAKNGSVTVNVSGGVRPYIINLSFEGYNSTLNNIYETAFFNKLDVGNYALTIIDANNCTKNTFIEINEPDVMLSASIADFANPSCFGFTNGSIKVTALGGWGDYTYFPIGNGDGTFNNLGIGDYSIKVTDKQGCQTNISQSLIQPNKLEVSNIFIENLTCNGNASGKIQLSVKGGTKGYQFNFGNGFGTDSVASGLNANTYSYTVVDSKSCEISDKIKVYEPQLLTASIIRSNYNGYNISCYGEIDSVVVIPSGGTQPYKIFFNGKEYNCSVTGYKLKGISAGNYSIKIIDSNNCSIDQPFSLTQPAKLLINKLDINSTSCYGTSDGKIIATIYGGVNPYRFALWDEQDNKIAQYDGTIFDYGNLTSGNYKLLVEDMNGCSIESLFTINQPELLKASFNAWNVSCHGSEDGRAEANVIGGNVPYSYQWIGENDIISCTSYTLTNAKAYAWKVKITDSKGCSGVSGVKGFIESTIYINNPSQPLTLEANVTNVKCNGGNDGSIELNGKGGWGKYYYSDDEEYFTTNNHLDGLTSNLYEIFIRDSLGCTKKESFFVSELMPLVFTTKIIDATCYGSTNGSIEVQASGGTAPNVNYFINSQTFDGQIDSLKAGNYTIMLVDANGCVTSNSVRILEPTALSFTSEIKRPTCGNPNGSINIIPTGGVGVLQVSWLFGFDVVSIGNERTGLVSGNYLFRVIDGNSCSKEFQQRLSDIEGPSQTIISKNPICNNGNNGYVEVTVTSSILPCKVLFSHDGYASEEHTLNMVPSKLTYNNLTDGIYDIQTIDSNGCETNESVTLTSPDPLSATFTATPVSCFGGSDGSAIATIKGGTNPYTIKWFDLENNYIENGNSIKDLHTGYYRVQVEDANGCHETQICGVDIKEPTNPLTLSIISTSDVTCYGESNGNVRLLATGGWGNYKYSKDGNEEINNNFFDNLIAGTYSFKVSDRYGCKDKINVDIKQNNQVTLTIGKSNVKCFKGNDGSISLNATGGTGSYLYSINNGDTYYPSNSFDGLFTGTYKLKVKDENECLVSDIITLTQPSELIINISNFKDIKCNGESTGEVILSASGGTPDYQFSKDAVLYSQSNIFNNLYAGTNTFRVKDSNGCVSKVEKTLTQSSSLTLAVLTIKNVSCNGGSDASVTVQAFGGNPAYNYSIDGITWRNDNQFSNISANNYIIQLKDANNCSANKNLTISQPPQLMLMALSKVNVSCNGGNNGSIALSTSGGTSPYQYNMNEGDWQSSNEFNTLGSNTYSFKVNDAQGCVRVLSETITQPDLLNITYSNSTDVRCFGGSNGSVTLLATGGTTPYLFTKDGFSLQTSSLFNNLSEGNYSFEVHDAKGCTANISRSISQPPELSISLSSSSNVSCFGFADGSVTITASNGTVPYKYRISGSSLWQNSNNFSGLKNGVYTFEVMDNCGQVKSLNGTITQPTDLILSIENVLNPLCYGNNGSLVLSAIGGITPYQYSKNGSLWVSTNAFNDLPADSFTFYIRDFNGCQEGKSLQITQPSSLNLLVTTYTDVTCNAQNNGTVSLNGTGGTTPYQYSKGGNEWISVSNFNNISPGDYTFIIRDNNGCTTSVIQRISEPKILDISSVKNMNPLCYGYTNGLIDVSVNGGTTPYSYLWSNGSQISTTGNVPAGDYSLKVTDSKGCMANASYTLVNPPTLKPNLPGIVTICSNQTFDIDAGIPNASYLWFSENGFTSYNQNITLTLPGIYYLIVSDSKGCLGKDTLTLIKESNIIDANFLIPEIAAVGDTIVLIEMSWPIPQSIHWNYPASFIPIYQTDYSIYLVPQMMGEFTIGLNSFVGECSEYIDKSITIESPQNKGKEKVTKQSTIKDVAAFPNPNRGNFSVVVDLNMEADALIEIYSVYGKQIISRQFRGSAFYKIDVNLFHIPGIYLVRISAGNEFRSLRIIVE